MSWIPDRYRELRSLLRRDLEDEVDEELAHHIELRTADLVAAGMTPEQAREEALRRFGNLGAYRSETCEIEQSILKERRRMELMDAIRRETRFSLRALVRAPVFTIVAVLTLGVGIGATTAIFSLLDSIVLKPLPYPEPDELVQVNHAVPLVQEGQEWGNSTASFFYYGDEADAFEELGAYTRTTFNVSGEEGAERIDGAFATASLFRILGAEVVRGRVLTDADDQPGVDPVALISHEVWQTRYASDPSVVGRTITLNSMPVTIAGVLEPGFALPGWAPHYWLPRQLDRSEQPQNSHMNFITYGRLRDGATAEQAHRARGTEAAHDGAVPDGVQPGVLRPERVHAGGASAALDGAGHRRA